MTEDQIDQMRAALKELGAAIDFYDRVLTAPLDEKIAVGQDHINWIISAARRGAELNKTLPEIL